MNNEWRYTAKTITKYNPIYRNEDGHYTKPDWIGFHQVGKCVNGELLTFEDFIKTEAKYIDAAREFFKFHECALIRVGDLEKNDISSYEYNDKMNLVLAYNSLKEGAYINIDEIGVVIKLILRELVWTELFCGKSQDTALRFGYDLYMYYNTTKDVSIMNDRIEKLGLFVW